MRLFALAAIGVTTFAATMIFGTSNANAVVYCVRACTGPAASSDPASEVSLGVLLGVLFGGDPT